MRSFLFRPRINLVELVIIAIAAAVIRDLIF